MEMFGISCKRVMNNFSPNVWVTGHDPGSELYKPFNGQHVPAYCLVYRENGVTDY